MDIRHTPRSNRGAPAFPAPSYTAPTYGAPGPESETVPGYRRLVPHGVGVPNTIPLPSRARPGRVLDAAHGSFHTLLDLETVGLGNLPDDRVRVRHVTQAPWAAICALRITNAEGAQRVGTGWLIDARTVVTAGHCVFLQNEGGWATSIEVIPALQGAIRPFGSAVSTNFRAVDGWIDDRGESYDYGAILLDHDIVSQAGFFFFRVAALGDDELRNALANLAGYPADRDQATALYFEARNIRGVAPHRVNYDIDTYGGQSGSPIWMKADSTSRAPNAPNAGPTDVDRIVFAIHTTGGVTTNSGTRITAEIVDNLNRWRTGAV